jgi:Ulp1 family protease
LLYGRNDAPTQKNLARYACDEAADKKKETWSISDWKTAAPKDIPGQLNGCDCGVFMLKVHALSGERSCTALLTSRPVRRLAGNAGTTHVSAV